MLTANPTSGGRPPLRCLPGMTRSAQNTGGTGRDATSRLGERGTGLETRPRGVRFHPDALRRDTVSPLYDRLAQPAGAREERMRSGVLRGHHPQTGQNPPPSTFAPAGGEGMQARFGPAQWGVVFRSVPTTILLRDPPPGEPKFSSDLESRRGLRRRRTSTTVAAPTAIAGIGNSGSQGGPRARETFSSTAALPHLYPSHTDPVIEQAIDGLPARSSLDGNLARTN